MLMPVKTVGAYFKRGAEGKKQKIKRFLFCRLKKST
jgi:hypothetical protein